MNAEGAKEGEAGEAKDQKEEKVKRDAGQELRKAVRQENTATRIHFCHRHRYMAASLNLRVCQLLIETFLVQIREALPEMGFCAINAEILRLCPSSPAAFVVHYSSVCTFTSRVFSSRVVVSLRIKSEKELHQRKQHCSSNPEKRLKQPRPHAGPLVSKCVLASSAPLTSTTNACCSQSQGLAKG